MSTKGYFSHRSANGDTLGERVRAQAYRYCMVAENIAKGQPNERSAIESWMQSPGHRRNILDSGVTEYGMAGVGDVWVLVLARPGC